MRKFFSIALFVVCAFSLITMTDCGQGNVVERYNTTDHSYVIRHVGFFPPFDGYTYEFLGGTPEQRKNPKTAAFYSKGVVEINRDAVDREIKRDIETWQNMQQKR